MLGSAVQRGLSGRHGITAPGRAEFNILSTRLEDLPVAGHDWVVNAAGLVPRRLAPEHEMMQVNGFFPLALAKACEQAGARCLHVSTDCVFAGAGPHVESATPDAHDVYGRSKALGEAGGAMVLRTSIIGPEPGADALDRHSLLCWALRQSCLDGYVNHLWNGVTTWTLAGLIGTIIERDQFVPGVSHVHSETVTKYDLLRMICVAWRHDAEVRPVAAPEARDQRLASRGAGLCGGVPALKDQLDVLAAMSSGRGQWRH
jgi:dTDP-4-dehydrorhamnose reductase